MLVTDLDTTIVSVNRAFTDHYRLQRGREVLGETPALEFGAPWRLSTVTYGTRLPRAGTLAGRDLQTGARIGEITPSGCRSRGA